LKEILRAGICRGFVEASKTRTVLNGVEIHYVRNTRTGAVDDFKFK